MKVTVYGIRNCGAMKQALASRVSNAGAIRRSIVEAGGALPVGFERVANARALESR